MVLFPGAALLSGAPGGVGELCVLSPGKGGSWNSVKFLTRFRRAVSKSNAQDFFLLVPLVEVSRNDKEVKIERLPGLIEDEKTWLELISVGDKKRLGSLEVVDLARAWGAFIRSLSLRFVVSQRWRTLLFLCKFLRHSRKAWPSWILKVSRFLLFASHEQKTTTPLAFLAQFWQVAP